MNSDEHHDRLVDLLLCELVGKETPPDIRDRVLEVANRQANPGAVRRAPRSRLARARPARRSKVPGFAAVAIVVVLLGAVGAFVQFQQISNARTPVLIQISGTVDHSRGAIRAGESLSTGSLSSALLRYGDGSMVELASETTIKVVAHSWRDRSKELELVAGKLEAEVSPQPEGAPMVFSSSDARAEVIGTRLSFELNEDRTRLEVVEGAVRFAPRAGGREVVVESGDSAESGKSGFRHEKSFAPGIVRFTLMNAETDQPIREEALVNGEEISLASLPTRKINLRADFEGAPPTSTRILVTRHDGGATGLPPTVARPQKHPPFFVAGDHWADGRPNDCRAWTPPPGSYHISATAVYAEGDDRNNGKSLEMDFRITD